MCVFTHIYSYTDLMAHIHIVPVWAGLRDSREVEDRLAKIKADLLCEVIAVNTFVMSLTQ